MKNARLSQRIMLATASVALVSLAIGCGKPSNVGPEWDKADVLSLFDSLERVTESNQKPAIRMVAEELHTSLIYRKNSASGEQEAMLATAASDVQEFLRSSVSESKDQLLARIDSMRAKISGGP